MLEVEVIQAPTVRYTQDNKTPIAEMEVLFEGLRMDDEPGKLKVIGWGNLAQDLQNRVTAGQRLVLEGRLRMNSVPRQDGTKEKRAEFTLAKLHTTSANITNSNRSSSNNPASPSSNLNSATPVPDEGFSEDTQETSWNSSPLIPETDDIPF